ncbi:MAG: MBL fold metallo-hydrolase [Clostridia bacterium]|nr:MBL fold metallo-hydrolase [Clostridia bacterium]
MKVTTLASGSSGNAIYIEDQEEAILIDVGLSGRAIVERLAAIDRDLSRIKAILVTHEHVDHVKGVGVLSRKLDKPVYATEKTWAAMAKTVGPVADENRRYIEAGKGIEVGEFQLEVFATSHDAVDSVGYTIHTRHEKLGVLTDTGCINLSIKDQLAGSDMLICESNHDLDMLKKGPYPWNLKKRILSQKGHLSNISAGHILADLCSGTTQQVVLAHLSQENNEPDLAYTTVAEIMEKKGCAIGRQVDMAVAPRGGPGPVYDLGSGE